MDADFVVVSDKVFTGTTDNTEALAIFIKDKYIVDVMSKDEFEKLDELDIEVIDYKDKFICAGFHDAHEHVMHAALFPSALATEYPGSSEADCVEHMIKFAQETSSSSWLMSHGWRDNLWDPASAPTKKSLDEAFPDRPVAMYSGDSHTLWCNSKALEKLGLNDESEPPEGGIFDRDEEGHLSGVLREAAGMKYVCQILEQFDTDQLMEVYYQYFTKLLSMGITSVCDMAISLIPGADCILPEVYKGLLRQNRLHVRCHLYPTLSEDMSNLEDLQEELTTDMLQAPGFKQFFDGVSSQHTAWVTDDYENARFVGDRGKPTVDPVRMRNLVLRAASKKHSVRIHTIGDRAVHEAIDIFSEAKDKYGLPATGANCLEHIEDISSSDIDRFKECGLVASVQPPHVTIDTTQPARDLGEVRACRMWPFKTFEEKGITMALGTDAPVVGPESLDVLWCAIRRSNPHTHKPDNGWYPDQDLTRQSAIRAYTYGSAQSVGRQDELGLIKPGYLADFVVWDSDLLQVDLDKFQKSSVIDTYVSGKKVYSQR